VKLVYVFSVQLVAWLVCLRPYTATAGTVEFFNTNQVATLISSGTNMDTIRSGSYLFTYTLDKLFTGGVGLTDPIGRTVYVPWPDGVEAQGITTGPNQGSAKMTIKREDGALFSMPNITFKILANTAGAGASLEIMQTPDVLPDGRMIIHWSSVTNHAYTVYDSTNLLTGFSAVQSNIPATPPINSFTNSAMTAPQKFWKISTGP
jgi:hypothetical protein